MGQDGQPQVRVSICMATYNGAEYVEEQLASILDQLTDDDEVVIVDDASRDDTVAVVRAIGDPRIRVFPREVNKGYVRTFEEALRRARGQYLLLSDQDDVWTPDHVELLVAGLRDAQVVASNLSMLGGPDRITGPLGITDLRLEHGQSRLGNIMRLLLGVACYWGCAMGLRKDALDLVLPFPDFLTETHDQWIAMYGNVAGEMNHIEQRTVRRRVHGMNLTPARPRWLRPAISSRIMLLRSLRLLTRRYSAARRSRPAS